MVQSQSGKENDGRRRTLALSKANTQQDFSAVCLGTFPHITHPGCLVNSRESSLGAKVLVSSKFEFHTIRSEAINCRNDK